MIVITAPTGKIGHRVLAGVLETGAPVRVIVRDAGKLPNSVRDLVEVVEGSHSEAEVVDRAFADADSLFWLVPPDPRAATVDEAYVGFTLPAAEALKRHQVKRGVGISALGRGSSRADKAGLVTASLAMDDLIASTGVAFRAVTSPSFMDNIARQAVPIREKSMFFLPLDGDRKMPTCATRDIAEIAARCCWIRVGTGLGMPRRSGPRTSRSTTWQRSCPRCLTGPFAMSRSSLMPIRPDSSSVACLMPWRRA